MTGQANRPASADNAHQPQWDIAASHPMDWCFISKDPLQSIAHNAAEPSALDGAANENTGPRSWLDRMLSIVLTTAIVAVMCVAAVGVIAALYVVKSTLGIDLFAGHSFLHDWLYRRG